MRRQRSMFQTKEEDKRPEELREVELRNLPSKEFNITITKMLKNLEEEWQNTVRSFKKRKHKEE